MNKFIDTREFEAWQLPYGPPATDGPLKCGPCEILWLENKNEWRIDPDQGYFFYGKPGDYICGHPDTRGFWIVKKERFEKHYRHAPVSPMEQETVLQDLTDQAQELDMGYEGEE